ncbi:MAG TPA: TetR/AcrR family transcriptional regulator [Clostridia bacterium]|nr:TetR/AcrR family transcriptional regulator [Clostridia bacterium]
MARQSEKKLKRLLEKSEELFWNYGYNAVSVDQIAAEAGISKMTIYKHFHSKEDLFIEIMKNSIDYHMDKIKEIIKEKYHTIEKIEQIYNYSIGLAKEYPNILLRDIIEKKSILEKVTAMKLEKALPIWQYILEDGMSKKEIRELDLVFVSELLMNLPSAIKNLDFLRDKSKMMKFYENFMDFIKYGLLGGMENQQCVAREEGVDDAEKHTDES